MFESACVVKELSGGTTMLNRHTFLSARKLLEGMMIRGIKSEVEASLAQGAPSAASDSVVPYRDRKRIFAEDGERP